MPQVTQEKRTIMYSVEENGHVARHVFPFNAEDPMGMTKLMKFIRRGFTFDDPRAEVQTGRPQVIVTREVALARPEEEAEGLGKVIESTALPEVVTLETTKLEPVVVDSLVCSDCGRGPFKSEFGLEVHQRTCKNKK